MSSIIYCSTPNINPKIKGYCLERLKRQVKEGKHQLVIIEQEADKPLHIHSFYKNILKGMRKAKARHVFIVDHDCLYPDGYFEQKTKAELSYCKNVFYLAESGFVLRKFNYAPMSTLIGEKNALKAAINRKLKMEAIRWYEPGVEDPGFKGEIEWREFPHSIDIRHEACFTKHKQAFEGGRENLKPWGNAKDMWKAIAEWSEAKEPEKIPVAVTVPAIPRPDVSVIITTRNEELLSWTIDNIRRTSKGKNIEIIVGFDGWQAPQFVKQAEKADSYFFTSYDCLGVGRSRDLAIMRAKGEYIIIMDAHMDFKPGWIDLLLEPVKKDGKVLSCSRSVVMGGDCLNINKEGLLIRYGARLPIAQENTRRIPLDPVWHTDRPAGEIQCILGACYGFTRQRYFDICRPWEFAVGWGSSEQVISVINWFFGGSCVLTDAVSGHLYRTQSDAMERRSTNITVPGMFYNRLRLFALLPMDTKIRAKLTECVWNRSDAIKCKDRILAFMNMRPDRKLEDAIKASGRTFEDYVKAWYPPEELESLMKENIRPVIESAKLQCKKPTLQRVETQEARPAIVHNGFVNIEPDRRFV
jgi:hypothetical protein